MKMRPKVGQVLQGYFRVEPFRSMGHKATGIPSLPSGRSIPLPPRPDLLPSLMRSAAVQSKPASGAPGLPRPDLLPVQLREMVGQPRSEREAGPPWRRAPRRELLPGMGPAVMGGLHVVGQARSDNGVSATPIPGGHLRVIGEGRPLEPKIRQTMEAFFQADFSRVRVHEGPTAHAMGALAFTLGEDLHFAPGWYDPASRAGVELLGHELTHVVQQREGRVANPFGTGVAIVQDPALEAEADRLGQEIASEIWRRPSAAPTAELRGAVNKRQFAPHRDAPTTAFGLADPVSQPAARHRSFMGQMKQTVGILGGRPARKVLWVAQRMEEEKGTDQQPTKESSKVLHEYDVVETEWSERTVEIAELLKMLWKGAGGQVRKRDKGCCSGKEWTNADEGVDVARSIQQDFGDHAPRFACLPGENVPVQYQTVLVATKKGDKEPSGLLILELRNCALEGYCVESGAYLYLRYLLGSPEAGGCGAVLVQRAKEIAENKGLPIIVESSGKRAIEFYQKNGWEVRYEARHRGDAKCGCMGMRWSPG